jgi:hypothetical protein
MNVVVQVTVLPPPLEEPLHWLIVTGNAVDAPVTVHFTRVDPPPPFPEPLHCVTVAFVVLAVGAHRRVGWIPPPAPDPMHWLTVAPVVAVPLAMSFVTMTLQIKLLPPPTMMPLHWLTEVTNWVESMTVVLHSAGGSTPAAARHVVVVIVELTAPAGVSVLVIAMLQDTCLPAPVGAVVG